MVRLNRIYTRTGDDGTTGLGDGTRLPKDHARISAYGTVDELNSIIGLALTEPDVPDAFAKGLRTIQNELFDVGSDLCVPGEAGAKLRIGEDYVQRIEAWIDRANENLAALDSFILPGGARLAAWLHVARTVCRRAERLVLSTAAIDGDEGEVNPQVLRYLNRLSDLLFVLARQANDDGKADVLWRPGETSGS